MQNLEMGLILFFRVDDFDAALARARTLVAKLDEEPNLNTATARANSLCAILMGIT